MSLGVLGRAIRDCGDTRRGSDGLLRTLDSRCDSGLDRLAISLLQTSKGMTYDLDSGGMDY